MKDNRRDFIKKAALGSAVISSGGGLSVFSDKHNDINPGLNDGSWSNPAGAGQILSSWKVTFDEAGPEIMLISYRDTIAKCTKYKNYIS